jgi:hypothetical protein
LLLPTGKSLLIALAIIAAAAGGLTGARDVALRCALARRSGRRRRSRARCARRCGLGKSLLKVGAASSTATRPVTKSARSARPRFPNTLGNSHRRAAGARRQPGPAAYLIPASGRVVRTLTHSTPIQLAPAVAADEGHEAGRLRAPGPSLPAAIAVAPLASAPLPGGVKTVQSDGDQLTLVLGSGFEVRLGDVGDLRLKLAIARRILRLTFAATGSGYIDVSVPERPVLSSNSQVGG